MRSSKTEGKGKINDVMTEKNGSTVKEDGERNNQNKTTAGRQKIVVICLRRRGDNRQTKKERV